MLEVVVSGLVTGWAIAIPIGAVGAFLVTLTARTSFRVGAAGALGIASVDGAYAALAVVAGTALSALLGPVATPLRIASGLVLLVIAALTAAQLPPSSSATGPRSPRPARAWCSCSPRSSPRHRRAGPCGGGTALGRVSTGHRSHLVTGLVSAAVIAALAVRTMLG